MGAPRCFFKEGNTIPQIKERNQTDKVKGKKKSGKPAQASARRVMTAKLKKELAQRKRGGGGSAAEIPRDNITDITSTGSMTTGSASADSSTGAVGQVEQATQAAAVDVGRAAKRGASLAASKVKQKRREVKERRRQPDAHGQPPDIEPPASGGHGTDTPPGQPSRQGDAFTSTPPTPGDRMRQRAAGQRKEQLTRPWPCHHDPLHRGSIYQSIHQRAPQALHAAEREAPGRGHPAQDPSRVGTGRSDTGGPCQCPRPRGDEGRRRENR